MGYLDSVYLSLALLCTVSILLTGKFLSRSISLVSSSFRLVSSPSNHSRKRRARKGKCIILGNILRWSFIGLSWTMLQLILELITELGRRDGMCMFWFAKLSLSLLELGQEWQTRKWYSHRNQKDREKGWFTEENWGFFYQHKEEWILAKQHLHINCLCFFLSYKSRQQAGVRNPAVCAWESCEC